MTEMESELGSLFPINEIQATLHDSSGKEMEIPICDQCKSYKTLIIGKEAFMFFCGSCNE